MKATAKLGAPLRGLSRAMSDAYVERELASLPTDDVRVPQPQPQPTVPPAC